MSTIRQQCPACGRMLELPAEGIGRLGMCPACQATFIIGPAEASPAGSSDAPTSDVSLAGDSLDVQPTQSDSVQSDSHLSDPAAGSDAPMTPTAEPVGQIDPTPDLLGDNPWDDAASAPSETSNPAANDSHSGAADHKPSALGEALASVESSEPPTAWQGAPESEPQGETPSETSQFNQIYQTNADEPEVAELAGHPFSAPLPAGTTDELPPGTYVPNTKTVTYTQATAIGSTSIEGILSPTFSIYGERWSPLVLTFMILVAVIVMLAFVPGLIISSIVDAGGDVAGAILTLIWLPLLAALVGMLLVGTARVAIAVARNNTPAPMGDLIPPLPLVIRFFVGAVILGVCVGAASMAVGGTFGVLASAANNQQVTGVLSFFFILLTSAGSLLLHWLFWSWLFVVSDGKGTSFGSLQTAMAITMNNKLTSALLILIMVVMSAVGTIMCGVGHFLTAPFLFLMFAVAYLRMTEQPLDNPADRVT